MTIWSLGWRDATSSRNSCMQLALTRGRTRQPVETPIASAVCSKVTSNSNGSNTACACLSSSTVLAFATLSLACAKTSRPLAVLAMPHLPRSCGYYYIFDLGLEKGGARFGTDLRRCRHLITRPAVWGTAGLLDAIVCARIASKKARSGIVEIDALSPGEGSVRGIPPVFHLFGAPSASSRD
jgi:hypothetical protein